MRKLVMYVMVSCLVLSCSIPAVSLTFNEVYRLANKGDAEAQYILALMYIEGSDAQQNDSEGMKWLRKAAEQGHVDASCILGLCYY